MTLTAETEHAADLGYLLHKNPANVFTDDLPFGTLTVFYTEATPECCTVALLLEIDPIGLVRSDRRRSHGLDQYVNDRPYVASSLFSVALNAAFSTAMNGRSKDRPNRVDEKMRLTICLAAVSCSAGAELVEKLFAPLGYEIALERAVLDERFPEWGESDLYTITLRGEQTVQDALSHLYVLIPVLDNAKHYYIGEDEVEKLLRKGERWLNTHPHKALITRRYLSYRQSMVKAAMQRLELPADETATPQDESDAQAEAQEAAAEEPLRLNDLRLQAAKAAVMSMEPPARRVLDLGCGEGRLLRMLNGERSIAELVGADVANGVLEMAANRLHLDEANERQKQRLKLIQGSVVYRDDRFLNFDAALMIEVIEHLDPPRLQAMEQNVFGYARPRRLIVTTPNREYNALWSSLPAGAMRHRDHRFEWSRTEFQEWANRTAERYGYGVTFQGIGPEHEAYGCPTQMAIFDRR
jgi:3' terminal RNA ribose 2'-O-methyltransferase Hen1